jgi:hypothetical protein
MVTFANGKSIETIAVYSSSMQYQEAQRRTLEIRILKDNATFDELAKIFKDKTALKEITCADADSSSLQLNYVIPVELCLKTIDEAETWTMKIAQMSDVEIAQEKTASELADTQVALTELYEAYLAASNN